jgi:5-methyltetrahydropteroyltriglutamate--homocysteine methyltransferase
MSLAETAVFHAEPVGSLLRPPELIAARQELRAGRLGAEEYRRIEDRAVDDALRLQEDVGLDVVTDGEMRRDIFFDFLVKGFGAEAFERGSASTVRFHNEDTSNAMTVEVPFTLVGAFRPSTCPALDELAYAKGHTDRPVKICLPSPALITTFWNDRSREAYPDPIPLIREVGEAVLRWAGELAEAGCDYVQLDAPDLCDLYCDPQARHELYDARGIDSASAVEVLSEFLLQFAQLDAPGMRKGVHLCRGNGTQSWIAEGDYGPASEHLFGRLGGIDLVLLEYDDDRSGGFEPLAKLPEDTVAALGLVSTKWTAVEDAGLLRAQIAGAARHHPLERLALSPQCGFASAAETAAGRKITDQTQRDKLQRIVDVARQVWPG